jgi:hypothetical protein
MKILKFHDYSDPDELKQGVKLKLNTYEPEPSASVWDFIDQGLERNAARRRKRAIWFFAAVAGFILLGVSAWLIKPWENNSLAGEQKALATQGQQATPAPRKPGSTSADNAAYPYNVPDAANNPAAGNNDNGSATPASPSNRAGDRNTAATRNPSVNGGNNNPGNPAVNNTNGGLIANNNDAQSGGNSDGEQQKQDKETSENNGQSEGGKVEAVKGKEEVAEKIAAVQADTTHKKGAETPKVITPGTPAAGKWSIGVFAGPVFTNKALSSTDQGEELMKLRKSIEKGRIAYNSGIAVTYNINSYFGVKAGVSYNKYSEQMNYDTAIVRVVKPQGTPPYYEFDSIFSGNRFAQVNSTSYLEIPIEFLYTARSDKKLSFIFGAGAAYNKILKNQGKSIYIEPKLTGQIRDNISGLIDRNDSLFTDFMNLTLSAGIAARINNNCSFNLTATGKRALNSNTTHPEIRQFPYSVGLAAGITYTFKN